MKIVQDLLTINQYSRWGKALKGVKAVVIHWVANSKSTAKQNRDYFESRKDGKNGYGSAHYIVDLDGTIIQCIPNDEIAFHVGTSTVDPASGKYYTDLAREKFGVYAVDYVHQSPNSLTLGIELTHKNDKGQFTKETLEAAAELAAKLLKDAGLNPETDLLRHYDVVGWKDCPRWFVKNEEDWKAFKNTVKSKMSVM